MTVHALGDDGETCKACRGDWPCEGWIEQQSDYDLTMRLETVRTYEPLVPPHVTDRLRAALIGDVR